MNPRLSALQERIGHPFRNPAILEEAVTHRSFVNEHQGGGPSNQRLEFLGDAVLQLVLTEELFGKYRNEREGVLSKRRAALAKGESLASLAREIGLDQCLSMGPAEDASGGRTKASALEDAFEALIGAVYLDSDLSTARALVLRLYGDLDARLSHADQENPKGRLQELVHPKYGNDALRYQVTTVGGTAHAREYEVSVFLNDKPIGSGKGTSKKAAEENAARAGLEALG